MVVTEARDVPEGAAPPVPPGPNGVSTEPRPILPPHCRIAAELERRVGAGGARYRIGLELGIPAEWNGRFHLSAAAVLCSPAGQR
jgi:hypothetical protein